MKLTAQTFVSLDGVMQAPGAPDEDRANGFDLGGWQVPLFDEECGRAVADRYQQVGGLLLGRRTFDIFRGYWPHAADEQEPFTSLINELPKYVASRSEPDLTWHNSRWLGPDAVGAVRELKQQSGGELLVPGSGNLLQALFNDDLVDELQVLTFPVVLGKGARLFEAGLTPSAWELVESASTPKGAVTSVYRFVGRPGYGSF
jgi:dihydrofolate reductase